MQNKNRKQMANRNHGKLQRTGFIKLISDSVETRGTIQPVTALLHIQKGLVEWGHGIINTTRERRVHIMEKVVESVITCASYVCEYT